MLTLRLEERGTQKTLCDYVEDSEGKTGTTLDGGGLGSVVPGTASVNRRRGLDRNAREVGGLPSNTDRSNEGWAESCWSGRGGVQEHIEGALFCQPNLNRHGLSKEGRHCGSRFCQCGNLDTHQAPTMCEDRQVEVNASDASFRGTELTTRGQLDWSKRTVFWGLDVSVFPLCLPWPR